MLSYNFQLSTYTPANTHCEPAGTLIMFLLTQLLSMLVNSLKWQHFAFLCRSGAKAIYNITVFKTSFMEIRHYTLQYMRFNELQCKYNRDQC